MVRVEVDLQERVNLKSVGVVRGRETERGERGWVG